MDEQYIKQRIAKLRTDHDISARELSLQLGQSTGYINTIENGKSLPSMKMFLYICEYFHITPKEFFDEEVEYPVLIERMIQESKKLDANALESILGVMKNMEK